MAGDRNRSAVACRSCHSQKLKCSGKTPCQRCTSRGRECVYPSRERLITVPEGYVRELERLVKGTRLADENATTTFPELSSIPETTPTSTAGGSVVRYESLESSSAEGFVQRLKELSSPTADDPEAAHLPNSIPTGEGHYTYSLLRFDFFQPEVSFKLPPKPYALHLLQVFEEGFCDYHWYLRGRFHERLELTYLDPTSQSGDRNWLCRVSVVMALAEAWNYGRLPPGETHPRPAGPPAHPPSPPGSDFFEQGLLLLQTASEEIVEEHVEACNLIAFYCYSLNRRRMAYSFAAQGIAFARLLHLGRPSPPAPPRQQRIRPPTDLGLEPAQLTAPGLPSEEGLVGGEAGEFFDARLLTAQAQLCEIKRHVVEAATARCLRDAADDGKKRRVIQPCLDMLRVWREGLGPGMTFEFENGVPGEMMALPFARVLASLYLRYYQCFILLLRPFYLQELPWIVHGAGKGMVLPGRDSLFPLLSSDVATLMKVDCLRAAQNNCKILLDLCKYGKIARFGYWESYHLFSGLAILCLAKISVTSSAGTDADLYARARTLLEGMAGAGNPASKDHEALLSDVELMVRKLSARGARSEGQSGEAVESASRAAGDASLGSEGLMGDLLRGSIDWEDLLRSYA